MHNLTFENHFKFGYEGQPWFEQKNSTERIFTFQYGKIKNQVTNWRQANKIAAETINASTDKTIYILGSGGMDSEVCQLAFIDAKVKFKVAIMKYENDLNEHDIRYAVKFCKQYDLPYEVFELNVSNFWSSQSLYDLVDPIYCVSAQLGCHLWLANQVKGFPILAQGEPFMKKNISVDYRPGVDVYDQSGWSYIESERLCSLYRHFILNNKEGVPGFFQYLPEQIDSYVFFESMCKDLVENKLLGKINSRSSKNKIIREHYPEIEPRRKYTGFEFMVDQDLYLQSLLRRRFINSNQDAAVSMDELKKMLSKT